MSVRKKPASPGVTESTPTRPPAGSTTQWRAKIFSARVIGGPSAPEARRSCEASEVVRDEASSLSQAAAAEHAGAGTVARPCIRATLNSKRPPYSMIWRVISSLPRVNSSSWSGSPRAMRSATPKSVVVSTPRFWQFSL